MSPVVVVVVVCLFVSFFLSVFLSVCLFMSPSASVRPFFSTVVALSDCPFDFSCCCCLFVLLNPSAMAGPMLVRKPLVYLIN